MKQNLLRRAALAVAISTVSSGSMAAGFYLQESGTTGLGRAYAAENTIGDNASILGRNPAGSALFDSISLSGGFIYVNPEIDAAGTTTYFFPDGTGGLGSASIFDTADDYATDAFVPNGYVAVPLDPCWSLGLAMYTTYGLETDFDPTWPVTNIADQTELLTVNIAPSVAYDFNDQFSIGVSVNFVYADAKLNTMVPRDFLLNPDLSGSKILDYDDADDWDVSWAIGALWRINDQTRFGISYHAEIDPKLEGDVSSDFLPTVALPPALQPAFPPFDNARGDVTLDLPDTLELGFYHRFDEQWGIAAGVMWTDWDDFERLEAFIPSARLGVEDEPFNPLLVKEENFESGFRYSIAGEYYPCEEVTWRIGYAYDEGAARDGLNQNGITEVEETIGVGLPVTWRTLSIPDTDRQWITFGGTYKFDKHLSIDGGFAYLWGDDETVQEFGRLPVPTYFDGETTNIEAWLIGASVNYTF
ncbi:Long-chain fatty acid transport protein precursor [Microbulbifer aggregans]|uniref:Long-chain fatty acid transport protein n=1 Tax=Microbulbifer aggregans TaxID=1769779 RepID=A0A1C9W8C1_9GAMM|nr:outer membrane protein transport protein [Microbulbifer aggregans]AOS97409.1 Long-chain fatty acid transport protein precursor [Microbulbifer aggregans]